MRLKSIALTFISLVLANGVQLLPDKTIVEWRERPQHQEVKTIKLNDKLFKGFERVGLSPIKVQAKTPVKQPQKPSGTCEQWMAQAGIALTPATQKLIVNESGCNPTAQNPTSSAYGIGQFLDSTWATVGCVKTSDPVIQLRCMQKYVTQTYTTWDNALAKWYSRCDTPQGCWY